MIEMHVIASVGCQLIVSGLTFQLIGLLVSIDHIPHVGLTGISLDVKSRIEGLEYLHLVKHRQGTSHDDTGFAVNQSFPSEDFRKVLCHTLSDSLMLAGTQRCQFANTALRLLLNLA